MARRGERASLSVLAAVAFAAVLVAAQADLAAASEYTPKMEEAARSVVKAAIRDDNGVGAALIRLLFHDCWVMGCDASVLVGKREDSKLGTGTEKNAFSNIGLGGDEPKLAGFKVIDDIKAKLPEVSCADIVVFAAREATIILSKGEITYPVKAGRWDGLISSATEADNSLPGPSFSFQDLKANFEGKGFNQTELAILSGAHAIGKAHYQTFNDRLESPPSSPIDGKYQAVLIKRRRDADADADAGGLLGPIFGGRRKTTTEVNNVRDMDLASRGDAGYQANQVDTTATGVLDNSYYNANLQDRVLFTSDWELTTDTFAAKDIKRYKDNAKEWYRGFGDAMAKLSNLGYPGVSKVIRTNCRNNK